MTAADITEALRKKHAGDVFVRQCKTGPTWFSNGTLGIIDVVAIKKTWTELIVIGYEIKVSRSDFLNDDKCRRYLDFTTDLYFACPWKLIQPEEVPPECGLVWVAQTGTRVVTKKKAPRREIDADSFSMLARYILHSRVVVTDDERETKTDRIKHYERIVEAAKRGKKTASELARYANGALEKENLRLREELWRAQNRANDLERELKRQQALASEEGNLARLFCELKENMLRLQGTRFCTPARLQQYLLKALAVSVVLGGDEDDE